MHLAHFFLVNMASHDHQGLQCRIGVARIGERNGGMFSLQWHAIQSQGMSNMPAYDTLPPVVFYRNLRTIAPPLKSDMFDTSEGL